MFIAAEIIPLERLAIGLIPVGVVLMILTAWSVGARTSVLAIGRMLAQLLILGYLLRHIFAADSPVIVMVVLSVMLIVASWIALRVVVGQRRALFFPVWLSILAGGGCTLAIVTQGILQLRPWYEAQKMIPLAGMIFSNCMNAVSLALERYTSEKENGQDVLTARGVALKAALIPITNSLFAVGLVSIPGMMTGQVLSGTEPAIAARYQIMVMCMVFASAGLSAALCLFQVCRVDLPTPADEKKDVLNDG